LKPKAKLANQALFPSVKTFFNFLLKEYRTTVISFVFVILGYLILGGTMPNINSSFGAIPLVFPFSFYYFLASFSSSLLSSSYYRN